MPRLTLMPEDVVVNKEKFDRLLKKMLDTPPLPASKVKVCFGQRILPGISC